MKVEDLDVLRPEPRYVKIGGKEVDVSFIPCGITFEIDRIVNELRGFTQEDMLSNNEITNRAFDLSIDMCVAFCERKYPELNKEYFMDNCSPEQIRAFSAAISEALYKAYAGIIEIKNLKAPKKKNP
jgi:hypothetical protein